MKHVIPWLPLWSAAGISLLSCNEGVAKSQSDAMRVDGAGDKGGEKVQLVISRWAGSHADDQAAMLGEFEKATGIRVRMDAIDYGQLRQKQMLNMGGKTGAYDLVLPRKSGFRNMLVPGISAR
jgi:spermidine/putrescine-binding protein